MVRRSLLAVRQPSACPRFTKLFSRQISIELVGDVDTLVALKSNINSEISKEVDDPKEKDYDLH